MYLHNCFIKYIHYSMYIVYVCMYTHLNEVENKLKLVERH